RGRKGNPCAAGRLPAGAAESVIARVRPCERLALARHGRVSSRFRPAPALDQWPPRPQHWRNARTHRRSRAMRTGLIAALAVLLFAASPVRAHGGLPSADWCDGGQLVEVASFQIAPEGLLGSCARPGSRTCGQFDDDYGTALAVAQQHCGQYASAATMPSQPDHGSTSPLMSGPDAFLSPEHHALYEVGLGVEGICLRCVYVAPDPVALPKLGAN